MTDRLTLPIETERLLLRDFVEADFAAVHAYASDTEVTRYMFYPPRSEADTRNYIRRMIQSQSEEPRVIWELAIVRRSDGRLIGACDVTIERESEGDLGYILAREAWGQGYASEVAAALVQAGFEQLKLKRIFAICDVNNYGSIRVLEKAGLRREVMLENYKEAKGRWWNVYFYALTHSNWLALRESENHRLPNSI